MCPDDLCNHLYCLALLRAAHVSQKDHREEYYYCTVITPVRRHFEERVWKGRTWDARDKELKTRLLLEDNKDAQVFWWLWGIITAGIARACYKQQGRTWSFCVAYNLEHNCSLRKMG
ncbi:unnamed protein product [Meganyctiphanes norvegica]|uniref:Uncharacterized protein n=1 Tax=Meganyctiphanes norvegica TaxID=48144 RepID=A0AAV2Q8A2_MEGNR